MGLAGRFVDTRGQTAFLFARRLDGAIKGKLRAR